MNNRLSRAAGTVAVLAMISAGGCATIMNSSDQNVAFNTDPSGATVSVEGISVGTTPVVVPLARKGGDKTVMLSKPGYKTVTTKVDNTLSGWLLGNLIFGGIPGLIVDAVSGRGGAYRDSVIVKLEPGSGAVVVDPSKTQGSSNP